jgi:5-methylcytosine-specific restriction endonuclease McrA
MLTQMWDGQKRSKPLPRTNRDYKSEYDNYHKKPKQIANRSARNQARKAVGLKKGDPKEVDHKVSLSKGGSNAKSNLRIVSRITNRKKKNK